MRAWRWLRRAEVGFVLGLERFRKIAPISLYDTTRRHHPTDTEVRARSFIEERLTWRTEPFGWCGRRGHCGHLVPYVRVAWRVRCSSAAQRRK